MIAAVAAFALFGEDRLFWTRAVPWAGGALVFGLSTLPLAAALCGLLLSVPPPPSLPAWRRSAGVGVLLALSAFQSARPFLGRATAMDPPRWDRGVAAQTSEASCSAASAATLLATHGVPANEAEMAALCLTRAEGTPMLGVYRGLSRKARGAGRRVRVFTGRSVADLRAEVAQHGPVLLSVGLDRWQRVPDPRYVTEWGWTPGRRHAVVLFRFLPGGKLDIGDPSAGRETWDESALEVLWHGEGLLLAAPPKTP